MQPGAPQSSLLARLATGTPSRAGEVGSIVAHLHALLNARRGSSLASAGYGLLDLLPLLHTFPDSRHTLCEQLRAAIVTFEPRLTQVRVVQVEGYSVHALHFHIEAALGNGEPVRLTTRVVGGQRLEVGA